MRVALNMPAYGLVLGSREPEIGENRREHAGHVLLAYLVVGTGAGLSALDLASKEGMCTSRRFDQICAGSRRCVQMGNVSALSAQ